MEGYQYQTHVPVGVIQEWQKTLSTPSQRPRASAISKPILNPDMDYINNYIAPSIMNAIASKGASNVLVVFDLDGTLTMEQNPDDTEYGIKATRPRVAFVNFLQYLLDNGVQVIISSAWDKFEGTVGRIQAIGLSGMLAGETQEFSGNIDVKFRDRWDTERVNILQNGSVISCSEPRTENRYFRHKAFAALYATKSAKGTAYFLIDDSDKNVKLFGEDMQGYTADTFLIPAPSRQYAQMPSSKLVAIAARDLKSYPIKDIQVLAQYYSINPNQSFASVCRLIAKNNLQKAL